MLGLSLYRLALGRGTPGMPRLVPPSPPTSVGTFALAWGREYTSTDARPEVVEFTLGTETESAAPEEIASVGPVDDDARLARGLVACPGDENKPEHPTINFGLKAVRA